MHNVPLDTKVVLTQVDSHLDDIRIGFLMQMLKIHLKKSRNFLLIYQMYLSNRVVIRISSLENKNDPWLRTSLPYTTMYVCKTIYKMMPTIKYSLFFTDTYKSNLNKSVNFEPILFIGLTARVRVVPICNSTLSLWCMCTIQYLIKMQSFRPSWLF